MNPEQEPFGSLRRLLALKRFEQPPPGFFDGFSRDVILRIKAGEIGQDSPAHEGLFAEPRWLQRILAAFETKPAVAGAFGLAMCALLTAGVLYSENVDTLNSAGIAANEQLPRGSIQIGNPFPRASTAQGQLAGFTFTNRSSGGESLFEEFRRLNPPKTAEAGFLSW